MKKALVLFGLIFIVKLAKSQGWDGSGQDLYTVNAPGYSNVNVGINTASPTASLHVNGTVRFQGLTQNNNNTRVLVTDANGNVNYRSASTLGANAWQLTGNSGTVPGTNFLGTTDANRLVFKTNSTEWMTLLSTGQVGIGLSTPQSLMHIYGTTADNHLYVSGTAPSMRMFSGDDFSLSTSLTQSGVVALATRNNDFVNMSVPGDFVVGAGDTIGSLIFQVGAHQVGGYYNGIERMRISKVGYVGIATIAPTAKLDIDCSAVGGQSNPSNVRFENLQTTTSTYSYLVIDGSGYVYAKTGAPQGKASTVSESITDKIASLEAEIKDLKSIVQTLASSKQSNRADVVTIYPNPASTFVKVQVINNKLQNASVEIKDVDGRSVVNRITFNSVVTVPVSKLPAGVYFAYIYDEAQNVMDVQKVFIGR